MHTETIHVDPQTPDPAAIARAAAILRGGGLVAFPTETVYGLGASAVDAAAVARIFQAKERPQRNPIIVHVASAAAASDIVAHWPQSAQRLTERFWPGPLTLVLQKNERIAELVTVGGPTVAVRVPAHPVALALLRECALPIAAPSANRSTALSPTCAAHVLSSLSGRFDLLLDAGPTPGGLESTVVDLTETPPRLLRPGLVSPAQLIECLGHMTIHVDEVQAVAGPLPSPGMLERHYAPKTLLEAVNGDIAPRLRALSSQGLRVGCLAFSAIKPLPAGATLVVLPCEPAVYAARLYAVLHELDEARLDRIIVELPPDSEEWLAVRDRLRRAAGAR